MNRKPLFLLVNDDGVHAPGLRALRLAVEGVADVIVVAPHVERSGAGQALTLSTPLRCERLESNVYALEGTPTDCVLFAVNELVDRKPDWVLSGINRGSNIGQDTLYSGTVAAAMEGAIHGLPAVAFSFARRNAFDLAAYLDCVKVVRTLLDHELVLRTPGFQTVINVNIPDLPLAQMRGVRVASLGRRIYDQQIVKGTDPRGRPYYWVGGGGEAFDDLPGSDCNLLAEGYVTVSVLEPDHVNHEANARLRPSESRLDQALKEPSA